MLNNNTDSKFIFNWVLVNKIGIGIPLKLENDVLFLKKKNINSILSLCSSEVLNEKLYKSFNQKIYELPDHRSGTCPDISDIKKIIKLIDELIVDGPIFIHCEAGIERSPLICIAWLTIKESIPFEHSVRYLKQVHPNSNPHYDQLNVLKNELNKNK